MTPHQHAFGRIRMYGNRLTRSCKCRLKICLVLKDDCAVVWCEDRNGPIARRRLASGQNGLWRNLFTHCAEQLAAALTALIKPGEWEGWTKPLC